MANGKSQNRLLPLQKHCRAPKYTEPQPGIRSVARLCSLIIACVERSALPPGPVPSRFADGDA
eukprot:2805747-Prymnesium_polylepis.1